MVKTRGQKTGNLRSSILAAFFVLCFLAITLRLAYLQLLKGKEHRARAEQQRSMVRKLLPSRGEIKIIDRSTKEVIPVATNIQKTFLYAVPQEILDPSADSKILTPVLKLEQGEILQKISDKTRKYVIIKKQITAEEEDVLRSLKLKGFYFDSEGLRFYPQGELLSQVLGFVGFKNTEKEGLYGLESFFEKELKGTEGILKQEKDMSGAWIYGSSREMIPAEDGRSLILTIDKTIQFKTESILEETVKKHEAESGSVIVADPKTGKILAMAGYPDFNPNEYGKVADPRAFTNEATFSPYEPGSVFKPLTLAAAINEGKISPDTVYTDTGEVKIDKYTIKNSDLLAHGEQTMTQALEKSLNTGMIFAKDQIGNDKFLKYVRDFGFGQATGIELPERKGSIDNLKAKILVNFHTASFGQGISVTPIQLIQAFTAITNDGKMLKPYIIESEILSDGKIIEHKPQEIREVISKKTASTIGAMMVNVVENGHGKRAAVPGYYIAGKTGTAQVPKKDGTAGYEKDITIGSFIGFGPVSDPKFLILVRINYPKTVAFAESTAAPAFGELAQFILNYYQIPPNRQ